MKTLSIIVLTIFIAVCSANAQSTTQPTIPTSATTTQITDTTKTPAPSTRIIAGTEYTAMQLKKAMETDIDLKVEFAMARKADPSLLEWYDTETNALAEAKVAAQKATAEAQKATADANKATADANKAKADAEAAKDVRRLITGNQ